MLKILRANSAIFAPVSLVLNDMADFNGMAQGGRDFFLQFLKKLDPDLVGKVEDGRLDATFHFADKLR